MLAGATTGTTESPRVARFATLAAGFALAALAVALLLVARGPHRIGAFDVESDFYGGYAQAANAMRQGHLLNEAGRLPAVFGFVGPLYPALLALGGLAFGDLFTAAELLSAVACVAAVACWFLLLRRRASTGLALVIVLLLAANPLLFRYGYSATTDTTALAFQSAALLVLFTRQGRAAAAAAGLLAGLAFLTRYTSVYLVPAGLVALFAGATLHARRGPAAMGFVLGFLALVAPWQIYGRLHGAEVQFHQLLAFDVYANARGMNWDTFLAQVWPRFEHAPLSVLTSDPGAVVKRLLFNVGDHLRLDGRLLLGQPVAALALLAPLLALLDRRLLALAPLGMAGAWAFVALIPAAHNERYSLMVLPFYLLLAGASLTVRPWPGARGIALSATRVLAVGAVVTLCVQASIREQVDVLEQQPLETLACAERLRALARPDDRVIARKPNLAFHAGAGAVYFPAIDSLSGLARYARETGARWLYASPAEVQLRPAVAYLLDSSATIPGLTLRAYSSVPTLVDGLAWRRVAALYEIGPGFGEDPDWFATPRLRALHTLRGMAATLPDARTHLRLARFEMLELNLEGAQAAWREAVRIDPVGVSAWLRRFNNDTLMAVGQGQALLQ